jgi:hypothetical protein
MLLPHSKVRSCLHCFLSENSGLKNHHQLFYDWGKQSHNQQGGQLLEGTETVITQLLYLGCSQNGNNPQQQTQAGHYGICKYPAGS